MAKKKTIKKRASMETIKKRVAGLTKKKTPKKKATRAKKPDPVLEQLAAEAAAAVADKNYNLGPALAAGSKPDSTDPKTRTQEYDVLEITKKKLAGRIADLPNEGVPLARILEAAEARKIIDESQKARIFGLEFQLKKSAKSSRRREKKVVAHVVADLWIQKMIEGNFKWIKDFNDRVLGQATKRHAIEESTALEEVVRFLSAPAKPGSGMISEKDLASVIKMFAQQGRRKDPEEIKTKLEDITTRLRKIRSPIAKEAVADLEALADTIEA